LKVGFCFWPRLEKRLSMTNGALREKGYDIVINGENRYFADLELSAIACAGFHKEHAPEDRV